MSRPLGPRDPLGCARRAPPISGWLRVRRVGSQVKRGQIGRVGEGNAEEVRGEGQVIDQIGGGIAHRVIRNCGQRGAARLSLGWSMDWAPWKAQR
jgi:hypothetical protein